MWGERGEVKFLVRLRGIMVDGRVGGEVKFLVSLRGISQPQTLSRNGDWLDPI